jgi:hypothetical protein
MWRASLMKRAVTGQTVQKTFAKGTFCIPSNVSSFQRLWGVVTL